MAWYEWFSNFYDVSLEGLYLPHRERAFERIKPFDRALLVPCGTGQDLVHLQAKVAPGGSIVGVDLSPAMVRRTVARVDREGWSNVETVVGDATQLPDAITDGPPFDLVVCSLGLTVVPDYMGVFEQGFSVLRPGGQMIIFDVWAEHRTFQTWQVELIARAKLDRKVWEALEAVAEDFQLTFLDGAKPSTFGGRLFVASGIRPDPALQD